MNNSYKKAVDKIELSDELKEKIINTTSKSKENKMSKFRPVSIRRASGLAACFVFCFLSYYAVTNFYNQPNMNIVSVDNPEPTPDNSLKVIPINSEEPQVKNPPAYKKVEVIDNQIGGVSKKQKVTTENNSPAADNGLPACSKGKVSADDNTVSQKSTVEDVSAVLGYEIKFPQDVPEGYEVSDISVVDENIAKITYQGENDRITYRTAKSSECLSKNDNTYEFMEIVNVNNIDIVLKGNEELYYNAVWCDNTESFSITSDSGVKKDFIIDMISSVDDTEQPDIDNENHVYDN